MFFWCFEASSCVVFVVTRCVASVADGALPVDCTLVAIERISKKWKRPIRDWVAALNHFSVVFKGRIPE